MRSIKKWGARLYNLEEFGMSNLTFEIISKMSKNKFKEIVKKKCEECAFTFLTSEQKSKIENKNYVGLKLQDYLKKSSIPISLKKFIFKYRTKMIKVAKNFGKKDQCPLCYLEDDDQNHLAECYAITLNDENNTQIEDIADIFSNDSSKIEKIGTHLYQRFRKREVLLEARKK